MCFFLFPFFFFSFSFSFSLFSFLFLSFPYFLSPSSSYAYCVTAKNMSFFFLSLLSSSSFLPLLLSFSPLFLPSQQICNWTFSRLTANLQNRAPVALFFSSVDSRRSCSTRRTWPCSIDAHRRLSLARSARYHRFLLFLALLVFGSLSALCYI